VGPVNSLQIGWKLSPNLEALLLIPLLLAIFCMLQKLAVLRETQPAAVLE
jgi:hypothetical protein